LQTTIAWPSRSARYGIPALSKWATSPAIALPVSPSAPRCGAIGIDLIDNAHAAGEPIFEGLGLVDYSESRTAYAGARAAAPVCERVVAQVCKQQFVQATPVQCLPKYEHVAARRPDHVEASEQLDECCWIGVVAAQVKLDRGKARACQRTRLRTEPLATFGVRLHVEGLAETPILASSPTSSISAATLPRTLAEARNNLTIETIELRRPRPPDASSACQTPMSSTTKTDASSASS
jgi:hypothetical protein